MAYAQGRLFSSQFIGRTLLKGEVAAKDNLQGGYQHNADQVDGGEGHKRTHSAAMRFTRSHCEQALLFILHVVHGRASLSHKLASAIRINRVAGCSKPLSASYSEDLIEPAYAGLHFVLQLHKPLLLRRIVAGKLLQLLQLRR